MSDSAPRQRAGDARSDGPGVTARWLCFTALLVVAVVAGRWVVNPDTGLSLFWPAGGVAVLWVLFVRGPREAAAATLTVAVVAGVGNGLTGTAAITAACLGLANAVTAVTPRLLVRRGPLALRPAPSWLRTSGPDLLAWTPPAAPRTAVELWRFMAAAGVAVTTSAFVGAAGLALAGVGPTVGTLVAWIARNGAAVTVIALPVWTVAAGLRSRPLRARRPSLPAPGKAFEGACLVGATLLVAWIVFHEGSGMPLTYVPFALVVWAGLRFTPPVAASYAAVLATWTLVLVLGGHGGSFSLVQDPAERAITVQLFLVLVVALGLGLALVVAERDDLAAAAKRSALKARTRARDLRTITDTIPDGVFVVDRDGTLQLANPAVRDLLGARVDDVLVDLRQVRLRHLDGTPVPDHLRPSALGLAGQTVHDLVLREDETQDGRARYWSFGVAPLVAEGAEEPDRALIVMRDVTVHHERLRELEAFAGVVAHDLQNPLTVIGGWAEQMAVHADDATPWEGMGRGLDRIQRATERGSQLIDDLLSYSLASTAPLDRTRLDLDVLVDSVAETLESQGRHITVRHARLGHVSADTVLMRQVFANLLGNAVKYTPPERDPEVQVTATRSADRVTVRVADNGIGIPSEQRQRVFAPFHRAHAGDDRFRGTGIGLAICARAVERHGGTIEVLPNPSGIGSVFELTLPMASSVSDLPARPVPPRATTADELPRPRAGVA